MQKKHNINRIQLIFLIFLGFHLFLLISITFVRYEASLETSPLLKGESWQKQGTFEIKGVFFGTDSQPIHSLLGKKKPMELWGSWVRSDSNTGRLESANFQASEALLIFISGYPQNEGNQVYLEKPSTGEQLPLIHYNPREQWAPVALKLPENWKNSNVRIVAIDNAQKHRGWLGISTPYSIPSWSLILFDLPDMDSFKIFPLYTLNFILFMIPGLVLSLKLKEHGVYSSAFVVLGACGVTAAIGYLSFWLYWIHPNLGRGLTIPVLLWTMLRLSRSKSRKDLESVLSQPDILYPLSIMYLVGLIYLAYLYLQSANLGFDVINMASYRFLYTLPNDNIIPHLFAEKLYQGRDPRPIVGDWLSSDRPPLQTGLVLFLRPLAVLVGEVKLHYQLTATLGQCMWVPAVWSLCQAMKLSFEKILMVLAFLIFTGFFLLNSVYVWPKMLAGSLTIGTFLLLLNPLKNQEKITNLQVTTGALFAALSILTHGAAIFTLLAIAFVLLLPRYYFGIRKTLLGCLVFIICYTPWMGYQQFYEPPANRLVKWHIGGTIPIDDRTTGQTLVENYSQLGWKKTLEYKWSNLREILMPRPYPLFRNEAKEVFERQNAEFFSVMYALNTLNIGWLVLMQIGLSRAFRRPLFIKELPKHLKEIFGISLLTLGIWVVFMFGPNSTVNHQSAYALLILLGTGLGALITLLPRYLVYGLWLFHFYNFNTTWILQNSYQRDLNPLMIFMVVISMMVLGFLFFHLKNSHTLKAEQ
ncbi:hypothetical protein WDW89_00665 [Deltaproteobacteria bacterium TL4]